MSGVGEGFPTTIDLPVVLDPSSVRAERRSFLDMLYGRCEPGYWFCVWTDPSRVTRTFPTTGEGIELALDYIEHLDATATQHVFASMYILGQSRVTGRGNLQDVRGQVCHWGDYDVAGPGHKSAKTYPPTFEDALEIVRSLPLPPSMIVRSGHGIHAYWPFATPCYVDGDNDRAEMLDGLLRWKAIQLATARGLGWDVDSIWDATRIMRVPATWNPKTTPAARSQVVWLTDRRFDADEIDLYLPDLVDEDARPRLVEPVNTDGVELLRLDTYPEVFALALENDEKLRATWLRQRKDFTDGSPSAYCWALVLRMVQLGLTDEQAIHLLHTWRVANNAATKGIGWYAKNVALAREKVQLSSQNASFLEAAHAGEVTGALDLLAGLSDLLGMPITSLTRVEGADSCSYRLACDGRERKLASADALLNFRAFQRVAFDFGYSLKPELAKMWSGQVVPLLQRAVQNVDLGAELSEGGRAEQWIWEYLGRHGVSEKDPADCYQTGAPFWRASQPAIFASLFYDYLAAHVPSAKGQTPRDFAQAMKMAGCERKEIEILLGGARKKLTLWLVPEQLHARPLA